MAEPHTYPFNHLTACCRNQLGQFEQKEKVTSRANSHLQTMKIHTETPCIISKDWLQSNLGKKTKYLNVTQSGKIKPLASTDHTKAAFIVSIQSSLAYKEFCETNACTAMYHCAVFG